jgi:hypothetical protein
MATVDGDGWRQSVIELNSLMAEKACTGADMSTVLSHVSYWTVSELSVVLQRVRGDA